MSLLPQPPWDDRIKWKLDVLKFVLTFCIGALITAFVIGKHEESENKKRVKWQSTYGLKLKTFKDFEKNSFIYLKWSSDAFADVFWCRSAEEDDRMRKWEDEGYDNFKYSLESLQHWFVQDSSDAELKATIDRLLEQQDRFFKKYCSLKDSVKTLSKTDTTYCLGDQPKQKWTSFESSEYIQNRVLLDSLRMEVIRLSEIKLKEE